MKFDKRTFFYTLPPAWRLAARRLYYFPIDLYESLSGQRDPLMPPKGLIYTGGGGFKETGTLLRGYFQTFGGLQPHHQVLDIGSGIGRIAIPLTAYLSKKGSYEGFDVMKVGVEWCKKNITSRFPNFNFQYISLNNDLYRSDGSEAANFQFPYADQQFDFIVVNSVFTHMLPEEVANYMGEIARVLKKGGVCYTTFFILNEGTKKSMQTSGFDFPYDYHHYRLMDENVKSANVAFKDSYLKEQLLEKNGLSIRHLFWGAWRGLPKESCKEFQDIVIFEKA